MHCILPFFEAMYWLYPDQSTCGKVFCNLPPRKYLHFFFIVYHDEVNFSTSLTPFLQNFSVGGLIFLLFRPMCSFLSRWVYGKRISKIMGPNALLVSSGKWEEENFKVFGQNGIWLPVSNRTGIPPVRKISESYASFFYRTVPSCLSCGLPIGRSSKAEGSIYLFSWPTYEWKTLFSARTQT